MISSNRFPFFQCTLPLLFTLSIVHLAHGAPQAAPVSYCVYTFQELNSGFVYLASEIGAAEQNSATSGNNSPSATTFFAAALVASIAQQLAPSESSASVAYQISGASAAAFPVPPPNAVTASSASIGQQGASSLAWPSSGNGLVAAPTPQVTPISQLNPTSGGVAGKRIGSSAPHRLLCFPLEPEWWRTLSGGLEPDGVRIIGAPPYTPTIGDGDSSPPPPYEAPPPYSPSPNGPPADPEDPNDPDDDEPTNTDIFTAFFHDIQCLTNVQRRILRFMYQHHVRWVLLERNRSHTFRYRTNHTLQSCYRYLGRRSLRLHDWLYRRTSVCKPNIDASSPNYSAKRWRGASGLDHRSLHEQQVHVQFDFAQNMQNDNSNYTITMTGIDTLVYKGMKYLGLNDGYYEAPNIVTGTLVPSDGDENIFCQPVLGAVAKSCSGSNSLDEDDWTPISYCLR
ncbi:hypothetical protein HO173_004220 [Letharia columbiana]|uniref:Uncharacterized protein n=1 Tax=Letharia columbiana TaxID=112416 RepID=A0A8H6G042_9LECA|nr:uncharacterized protein HO173_004220 [Letharia columbiana]KAF6238019.1 hypothetical protein HO173_004220 [Letharia columbiana]